MEAGSGMFYPSQVVDGQVSLRGGSEYAAACRRLPELPGQPGVRCPVGGAVLVPAVAGLWDAFRCIIHAVPPQGSTSTEAWEAGMHCAWMASFDAAARCVAPAACEPPAAAQAAVAAVEPEPVAAAPLMGAGARRLTGLTDAGAVQKAARIAAAAATEWGGGEGDDGLVLCVGLLEQSAADVVSAELQGLGWVCQLG
jgi:hypothetical protein